LEYKEIEQKTSGAYDQNGKSDKKRDERTGHFFLCGGIFGRWGPLISGPGRNNRLRGRLLQLDRLRLHNRSCRSARGAEFYFIGHGSAAIFTKHYKLSPLLLFDFQ
jgi:hypothetical protein